MEDNNQEEMKLGEEVPLAVASDGAIGPADTQLNNPEDVNAYIYHTFYPQFCQHVDKLTSSELKRLSKFLVGYPLEVTREEIQFNTDEGLTAFTIGLRLNQAHMGLTLKALHDSMNTANETTETTTQENTDGEANSGGDNPQV